ncbi:hypothetical protein LUW77_28480 [Streptomyces radiopugnans]|nr:hypothetical protein LUW77_28480 [Streptomyces radiopugnans]
MISAPTPRTSRQNSVASPSMRSVKEISGESVQVREKVTAPPSSAVEAAGVSTAATTRKPTAST